MNYIFKRSVIVLASPFILLTGCNKPVKDISSSLSTSEQEYYNDDTNYENKNEYEVLNMICNDHGLYQVNEILHYKVDNEVFNSIKDKYSHATSISCYNSIKKAYEDYTNYKEYFNNRYDENTNMKLNLLYSIYIKYLDAFNNDDAYNVYKNYMRIETLINEFTINEILYLKFDREVNYEDINTLDNSPLCNLINSDDIDYKIKMLYDILYRDYLLDENGLQKPFVSATERLYRKVEVKEEIEDTKEKEYTYRMDSNGILWNE
jgi:hypothetical protein